MKNSTLAPNGATPLQKAVEFLRTLAGKPQKQRYADAVLRKIKRGEKHSTLGVEVRDEAYTRAKAERWLSRLVDYGLKPEHLCVEFGCGSLWAAEPVIRYLDSGRFIGLDVTDQFYEFGRQRIGTLLREKQVKLAVIAKPSLREIASLQPDYIYSRKVLPHVNKASLPQYMANVASLMHPKTVAVLDNTPTFDDEGNVSGRRHTVEEMQALLPASLEIRQERYAAIIRHRG